jgi:hypothetical protein
MLLQSSYLVRQSAAMEPKLSRNGWIWTALGQFALAIGASALLAAIVVVVYLTNQAEAISARKGYLSSILNVDVSTTLTIVRALQGLLTVAVTVLLSQSFTYIQWGFARHAEGAPYIRQLALSPTTTVWGSIRLILHTSSTLRPRLWAFFR